MDCTVCSRTAEYGCGDCRQAFYCSENCQDHDLEVNEHMLICAKAFDDRMRALWKPIYEKLSKLTNPDRTSTVRSYDTLVQILLNDSSQTTKERLVAMDLWISDRREPIEKFELESIKALSEVFRLALEDSLSSDPRVTERPSNRAFVLKTLLPELLDLLRKVCKGSTKYRNMEICPNFSRLRKDLKAAQRGEVVKPKPTAPPSAKDKTPKPTAPPKSIDLNKLWDTKCTGKAPWYGNAFHLMGAGDVIGEFMCKLALAPMTNAESDVIVMLLKQLLEIPGKGILQAILPAKIQNMLQRRLAGEKFSLTELESIFSKLMALPGVLTLVNSSKGLRNFGISTAENKDPPAPDQQLERKVDLNAWVRANCTDKESLLCLLQRGYKIGEFMCRLRLIPLQDVEWDLMLSVVNGTQEWVNSLSFVNPIKAAMNIVLSNGNYAKRRLKEAEPPLDTLEDLESLFDKLKYWKVLGLVSAQLKPYGLENP